MTGPTPGDDAAEGQASENTGPPEHLAGLAGMDLVRRALEGLSFDPLDAELCFVAAHGSDFVWGDIQSRPLYDRYLALRGIRAHDDRTIRGRELTERELEALLVVQRPFIEGQEHEREPPRPPSDE